VIGGVNRNLGNNQQLVQQGRQTKIVVSESEMQMQHND
jgi:hypothetical protein